MPHVPMRCPCGAAHKRSGAQQTEARYAEHSFDLFVIYVFSGYVIWTRQQTADLQVTEIVIIAQQPVSIGCAHPGHKYRVKPAGRAG